MIMLNKHMISGLVLCGLLLSFFSTCILGEENVEVETQYILPAPKKVVIDGNIKEWDKKGKIGPVTFDEEVMEEYNGTFYLMYDKDFLYLAAVIVQLHPPYNTYPTRGIGSWDGDDVIIRMSSNPELKVPIQMSQEEAKDSKDLFTADFWWNHLKNKTFWHAFYGIEGYKKMIVMEELPGSEAVVKSRADGQGYTMEAKLPWKVINPNFYPKPGDRIAFTWEISISSDNPAEPKRIFQIFANGGGTWAFTTPHMWGVAVFK